LVTSVFDLFKIGVGPSSSHTMGPMTAACRFVEALSQKAMLERTDRVLAELYGSLALTGKGHATDRAVLLGLSGERPDRMDPDAADTMIEAIRATGRLKLGGDKEIAFDEPGDLRFLQRERLPHHSNGMRFTAFDGAGEVLESSVSYSVGGGAVVDDAAIAGNAPPEGLWDIPYNYRCADELLAISDREGLTIAEIARANERAALPGEEIDRRLGAIVEAMDACIDRGIGRAGILPGGLNVKRRAPGLHKLLLDRAERTLSDPLTVLDWVNLWALAVNEENAAGGRVVTAPTNGAAGIVPRSCATTSASPRIRTEEGVRTVPAHRRRGRIAVQGECFHLRRRGGLPGRGRRRLLDGRRRPHRGAGRLERAGRERRPRSAWSTISASPAIRWRPRPGPLHRAQRGRRDQGDRGQPPRLVGDGAPPRQPRPGDRDDAQDRPRHERALQGDVARRPRGQRGGMLI
jgi:iron-sulfur-dependent L-serine dehydratase single chain form